MAFGDDHLLQGDEILDIAHTAQPTTTWLPYRWTSFRQMAAPFDHIPTVPAIDSDCNQQISHTRHGLRMDGDAVS